VVTLSCARVLTPAGVIVALAAAGGIPALAHLDPGDRIAVLTEAIRSRPGDATLHLRRGELHLARQDAPAALHDCRRASRLDPELAAAHLCTGRALLASGRPAEARHAAMACVAILPGGSEARILLARSLTLLGSHLEAAAEYDRVLESARRPGLPAPELYLERARALRATRPAQRERALAGLEEGLRTLGPAIPLLLETIDLEVEAGLYDAALHHLDRLSAFQARSESWLVRRGEILEKAGRSAEARAVYGAALVRLGTLPAGRRHAPATAALETAAREGLARLALPDGAAGTDGS
jgi:tetratricopeptide (TPR) repeat protein